MLLKILLEKDKMLTLHDVHVGVSHSITSVCCMF